LPAFFELAVPDIFAVAVVVTDWRENSTTTGWIILSYRHGAFTAQPGSKTSTFAP
jgi:hypothetical protein